MGNTNTRIENAVAGLGSVQRSVQIKAARALKELADDSDEEARLIVHYPGAVQCLLRLMGSSNDDVRHEASYVVYTLARRPATSRVLANHPGAVAELVKLLSRDFLSARTLECLTTEPANQSVISGCPGAVEGLAECLVKLVKTDRASHTGADYAAGALADLAHNNQPNQKRIGEFPGALQALVMLLGSPYQYKQRPAFLQYSNVQRPALRALYNLADNCVRNQELIVAVPNALPAIKCLSGQQDFARKLEQLLLKPRSHDTENTSHALAGSGKLQSVQSCHIGCMP